MYRLGIDIGSTTIKVVLIDDAGGLCILLISGIGPGLPKNWMKLLAACRCC